MTDGWALVPRAELETITEQDNSVETAIGIRGWAYSKLAAAPPVDGWQAIETLPGEMKNGSSRFLVAYTDGVVRVCRWLDNSKSDWPWQGVSPTEQIPMRCDAKMTHWMPLPQPPNNERTG